MGRKRRTHLRSLTSWQPHQEEKKQLELKATQEEETMSEEEQYPKRMEIWFAHLDMKPDSCIQGGDRPVLIVSNDINNRNSETVNILPITSKVKKWSLPSHACLLADSFTGLKQNSMVLAEQITTIDKKQLLRKIGDCSSELLQKSVQRTLYCQLGLEENGVG